MTRSTRGRCTGKKNVRPRGIALLAGRSAILASSLCGIEGVGGVWVVGIADDRTSASGRYEKLFEWADEDAGVSCGVLVSSWWGCAEG